MNSATDNPLVFTDTRDVVSGGNFHGEYPAKVYFLFDISIIFSFIKGLRLFGYRDT
jgi:histidine ammonia-lyase